MHHDPETQKAPGTLFPAEGGMPGPPSIFCINKSMFPVSPARGGLRSK